MEQEVTGLVREHAIESTAGHGVVGLGKWILATALVQAMIVRHRSMKKRVRKLKRMNKKGKKA